MVGRHGGGRVCLPVDWLPAIRRERSYIAEGIGLGGWQLVVVYTSSTSVSSYYCVFLIGSFSYSLNATGELTETMISAALLSTATTSTWSPLRHIVANCLTRKLCLE